ncbi:translation initiation factor eIF3 subunit g [Coemansia sp. RSA 1365]|nr:translation initiation factor eIF3 subunit g [Coemansia sp. RSA 1365]
MAKTSWADEVDENEFPSPEVISNPDGSRTLIEYRLNEDGKKVKSTRRIKNKVVQEHVNRAVAERKKWAKFGAERGAAPGPNISTTTVGEVILLRLSQYAAQQKQQEIEAQQQKEQEKSLAAKSSRILCRNCRGEHFTARCPYKDTLVPLEEITGASSANAEPGASQAEGDKGANSYVPPHMRAGAKAVDSMHERRDENPTIRITNLSENTQDDDVKQLCRPFGPIARAYVAIDRMTQLCKGFAFVSFYDHDSATEAIAKLNGHGFDHLILNVEWANSGGK